MELTFMFGPAPRHAPAIIEHLVSAGSIWIRGPLRQVLKAHAVGFDFLLKARGAPLG
jgi:hypothetical protein